MPRSILAFLLCLIFFPVLSAAAQTAATPSAGKPAAKAAEPTYDPAKEALIVEKSDRMLRFEADGTGVKVSYERIKVLADAGVKQLAVISSSYSAASQTVHVDYVRVIKPDGSIVETPSYNIQDLPEDITREAPMYSDAHEVHIAVKGLGVGDTVEYQITTKIVKPFVAGQFWANENFDKNHIYLEETVELDVPASKAVQVVSLKTQPTITKANGRTLYHWGTKNLSHPDPDAPEPPKKERHSEIQISTFKSWQEIGAWYKALADTQTKVTPAIQARVNADIKGLTSDEEKINAIFKDVALHIHYISLSFGIGRYQPHEADDVLSNEYGDCKDKHTLLTTMLKAAGYKAWPVLINAEEELDEAIPSPAQFDHVITLVPLNGKLRWMDSTEEVAPIDVLDAALREKKALVMPDDKPAYLIDTPDKLPFTSNSDVTVKATLDQDGQLKATMEQHYHGDVALVLQRFYRNTAQSDWQNMTERLIHGLGYGGEVTDVKVSDVEKIAAAFDVSNQYTRQHYTDFQNLRITPALPPTGWAASPGSKQIKPLEDIDIGSPDVTDYKSTIQLPKDWSANVPRNFHVVEDWAEYHATYSFANGTFTAERKLIVKKSKIPLTDWDKYLAFRHTIYDDETNMTMLEKPAGARSSTGNAAENYNRDQVDAYFQPVISTARDMMRALDILKTNPPAGSGDLKDALEVIIKDSKSIDEIMAKADVNDSKSLYLTSIVTYAWCLRGWAELDNNNLAVAESYLQASWTLGHDQLSGYLLGRVYEAQKAKDHAKHQYELAAATDVLGPLGGEEIKQYDVLALINERYKGLTGKEMTATLSGNRTNLSNELETLNEDTQFVDKSKFIGTGFYLMRFEPGKTPELSLMAGSKGYEKVADKLVEHPIEQVWPNGTETVIFRKVYVVCISHTECEAHQFVPTKLNTGRPMDNIGSKQK